MEELGDILNRRSAYRRGTALPVIETSSSGFLKAVLKNPYTFMLIVIVTFECLVVWKGQQFLQTTGLTVAEGYILSCANETFYMYFSSRKGMKSVLTKYGLLIMSIFLLSYGSYSNDENVIERRKMVEETMKSARLDLDAVRADLETIARDREVVTKENQVYAEREMITVGNKVLDKKKKKLASEKARLKKEKLELEAKLEEYSEKKLKQGVINSIPILSAKTVAVIFIFLLPQIAICFSLPSVLEKIKEEIQREKA